MAAVPLLALARREGEVETSLISSGESIDDG